MFSASDATPELGHRVDAEVRPRLTAGDRGDVQPGVVDQDVEPAEAVDRRLHRALSLIAVGDVGLDRESRAARCLDVCDERVEAVLAAYDGDDARAMLGELARGRSPDAAAGTGDKRHRSV